MGLCNKLTTITRIYLRLLFSIVMLGNVSFAGIGQAVSPVGSISSVKLILFYSPAGGENWKIGTQQNIFWSATNINNLKIELSTDNGNSFLAPPISASIPATAGYFQWIDIPNYVSNSCVIKLSEIGGSATHSSSAFTIFDYSPSFTSTKTISFNDPTQQTSYRMVSLPGNVDVLPSQLLTGKQKTDWDIYLDNGVVSNNKSDYLKEFDGTNSFKFKPGSGFWLVSRNELITSGQVNSVDIDSDNCYSIPIHANWNIISNPFDKSSSWAKVISENSLAQNSELFGWNGQWVHPVSEMIPFNGYYFYNVGNLTQLKIPYNPSGSLSKLDKIKNPHLYADRDLILTLNGSYCVFGEVELGINKSASNDYDTTDYFAPPGDFENVGIRIINDNLSTSYKQLFVEHRSEIGEGQEFVIRSQNYLNETLSLIAKGVNNFPDYEVYLVDKISLIFYNLKLNDKVLLNANRKLNSFSLFIGKQKYIDAVKKSLMPQDFTLFQNYPNPFNPGTVISYDIPVTGKVLLKIFDELGRLVQVLVNEVQNAGRYEVEFKCKTQSSGIYFYRLQSGNYTFTKKMILVK